MHSNRPKSFFLQIFENFRKNRPFQKEKYAEILHVARAVVTSVEKNEKRVGRIFFGSHFEEQSVDICLSWYISRAFRYINDISFGRKKTDISVCQYINEIKIYISDISIRENNILIKIKMVWYIADISLIYRWYFIYV